MKKIFFSLLMLTLQLSFAQKTLPKYKKGDMIEFYSFINEKFDTSKIIDSEAIKFSFTLDSIGKMNEIRLISYNVKVAAMELLRVLKLADKWDITNQVGNNKIKIEAEIFIKNEESVWGSVKVKWLQTNENAIEQEETVVEEQSIEIEQKNVKKKSSSELTKFYTFINNNFKLSEKAPEKLNGKIIIAFSIETDGSLTDFKIIKDLGYGTGEEAIRVLKLTSGKWSPAVKNGVPIKTSFTLPIVIGVYVDN
ncbi:energy transducer TonB [Flavobacterium sp. SUN046]|uniref:energy transducer TonB n=1 Tax=Flavobacterium sp. SUN046 TaxID=3002440 RepID=UPI002DB8E953|nr:energy transducer TonB [Flavobacterium sp. SUN046]MEC4050564.1 energy transducer TonB [Flavobacterium sp. SUN046]